MATQNNASLFIVYQGSLEANLYIDRLSNLTGAEIVAAFPTRHQATEYANKIKEFSTVVVERGFILQGGDENNLISLGDWKHSQQIEPEPEPEIPELTGSIAIIGQVIVGQTLTVNTDNLSGQGTIHYQWARSDNGLIFETIPSAISDYYVLTNNDIGKYIVVSVTREGTIGIIDSTKTDIVQDV